jgi:ABC-type spermidine/putrescine transport system permease subunit II
MPPTALALAAFVALLVIESRRGSATVGGDARALSPLPLGRARWGALAAVVLVLGLALAFPMWRHVETASGKHFGDPVAAGGATGRIDASRAKPDGFVDGLRKGIHHQQVGDSVENSLLLAGCGALAAVLIAVLATEAGRGRPWLDRTLAVVAFLPIAVPPMSFAVGWVRLVGPARAAGAYWPILLLAARVLPFATFAVRAAHRRIRPELEEAASVAGAGPAARFLRVTLPLIAPGAFLGFLLAFLFGLREVDAVVFTNTGTKTLPSQLYNMIHYGYDVQVAALSLLWTAGIALLLLCVRLLGGSRLRLVP